MDYQDMLSKLGLGSAHPGGFNATLDCLKLIDHTTKKNILEVGCGTGRTAAAFAKMGHSVTALDIRETMINKAQKRAECEDVEIKFVVGDACNLPFDVNCFDIVLIESVTVFININRAVSEYLRVLKPDGKVYDREMMGLEHLNMQLRKKIYDLYGAKVVPSPEQWIEIYRKGSFNNVTISYLTSIDNELRTEREELDDPYQFMDNDLLLDPAFFELSIKNTELMIETAPHLAHGIIVGTK